MCFASTICCMCLSEHSSTNFLELQKIERDLIQKITFVLPELPISKSKSPHYICAVCRDKIKYFYSFKLMCKNNYHRWIYYMYKLKKSDTQSFSELNVVLHKPNVTKRNLQEREDDASSSEEEDASQIEKEIVNLNKKLKILTDDKQNNSTAILDSKNSLENVQQNGETIIEEIVPNPIKNKKPDKKKEKTYFCNICFETFWNNAELLDHISYTHKGFKRHKCQICGIRFPNNIKLQLHHKRVHLELEGFECVYCSQGFETGWQLRKHLRHEHKNEPDVDKEIERFVNCSKGLKQQQDEFTEKRELSDKFKCDMCKKRCMNKAALVSHRKIHTKKILNNVKIISNI